MSAEKPYSADSVFV